MSGGVDSKQKQGAPVITDTALRQFVGFNVKRGMNVIHFDLKQTLDPFGLRMVTFSALLLIGDNPGLSQAQLAQALSMERPNLVSIVDELAGRDLVTRDRVPTDRRTYALRLTTAGARLLAQVTAAVVEHENELFNGIDQSDLDHMIATLKLIERNGSGRS